MRRDALPGGQLGEEAEQGVGERGQEGQDVLADHAMEHARMRLARPVGGREKIDGAPLLLKLR
jgi:hypothetical protein